MKRVLVVLLACSFLMLLNVTTWAVGDDINFSIYGDLNIAETSENLQIYDGYFDSKKETGSTAGLSFGTKWEMYKFLCGGEIGFGGIAYDDLDENDKAYANLKLYCGWNLYEDDTLRVALTGSYLELVYGVEDENNPNILKTFSIAGLGIGGELTCMLTRNLSLEGYVDVAWATVGLVGNTDDPENSEKQVDFDPLLMFYGIKLNYFLSDNVALYGGMKSYVALIDFRDDNKNLIRMANLGYSGLNMGLSLIF